MFSRIIHFLKYNNAAVFILLAILLLGGGAFAAANGIGQILLGTSDANLRGTSRGYNGLYSLDLSNAPTLQSPVVGFRCAK